jgi:hypothetical protein
VGKNAVTSEPLADLQRRAREAVAIANDQSLPTWQRVLQSLQAFAGTQLTGLPPKIYRAIEKHFVAVNRVLAEYDLEKGEDYERMAEADLQEILSIIKDLAAKIAPANEPEVAARRTFR